MRLIALVLRQLVWLTLGLVALVGPLAKAADSGQVMVRAVLFHAPDCGECQEVFDFLLPALLEHYQGRIQIAAFDISHPAGAGLLRAASEARMVEQSTTLPVILAGGKAFAGLRSIALHLGDDFETLAALPEASQWPAVPGMAELAAEGLSNLQTRLESAPTDEGSGPQPSSSADNIANGLAVVVLLVMALALLHSLVRVRRPAKPATGNGALITAVVLAGLLVSAYTAYTSVAEAELTCGPIGNCAAVQNSEYAKLFGIPMGVLGLLGYTSILVTWLAARRLSPKGGSWRWLPWALALFGVLFSLRLTALEPFVIGHTCLWCLGSALSVTATLWLLSGETARVADET